MADQTITPEIDAVLENGTFNDAGTIFTLKGKLSEDLYKKTDLILKFLGGKWNRSKGGHVFARDARQTLKSARTAKLAPDLKKRRQAYYTPEAVCQQIVDTIFLEDKLVLEPSAGCGNLAKACRDAGAEVHCIELDAFEAAELDGLKFKTTKADFLEVEPEPIYDAVIMNPPFTKNQDLKHVLHALRFLKPTGRLISIVSPSFPIKEIQKLHQQYGAGSVDFDRLEANTFKESGTNIETRVLSVRLPHSENFREEAEAREVENHGHCLAVEIIHGEFGLEIQKLTQKNPKALPDKIRKCADILIEQQYRKENDRDELSNLAIPDPMLAKIRKTALAEAFTYFTCDMEDEEIPPFNPSQDEDGGEDTAPTPNLEGLSSLIKAETKRRQRSSEAFPDEDFAPAIQTELLLE